MTTIFKPSYENDWGKLKILLKYFKGKKQIKLTLKEDSLSVVKW